VQFAGSETKQPGRNSRPKLKIVPNYPILRYINKFFVFNFAAKKKVKKKATVGKKIFFVGFKPRTLNFFDAFEAL
jgi:hypothetical protein